MARELIDKEKFYDKVAFRADLCDPCRDEMINLLDDQPAVDAVEVVRCKDCKWRNTKGCPYMNFNASARDDFDFCSDGERRTDV